MKTLLLAFMIATICCISPVATSQGGLAALAQSAPEGPIVVVDLVKFKPGGAPRYDIYDKIAEAKVKDLGGEVIFRGAAAPVPGMESGLPSDEWDRVTFRKYPSMQAVMDMGSSKEYQGAFPNRIVSVEKSFVYAYSGELPSLVDGAKIRMDPMATVPPPASNETVYMLNLLRFKKDGGRNKFFMKYGAASSPFIQKTGGGPVMMLKGIGPVIAMEEIDRLILVQYPSVKLFRDMVLSEEYQAIMHLRTEAIDVGLIWAFSMIAD